LLAPSVFPDIVEQAYKDSFPPDEIIHIHHGATPGEVDAAWRKGAKNLALYGESAIQVEPYKVEGKENDGSN